MSKELLKKAADRIEELERANAKLATDLATATDEKVKLAQHIDQVKTASVKQEETAAKAKAELGSKAKTAADKLFSHGLLNTTERRDIFASRILSDHGEALDALSKVAEHVNDAPKIATVVPGDESKTETADAAWDRAASKFLGRAGGSR